MRIVITGHGMVGHKFLENLLHVPDHHLQATMLYEELRPTYDRVHLSGFPTGKTAEEFSLVMPGFFDRDDVVLKLNAHATAIDTTAKTVAVSTGKVLSYDKLIPVSGPLSFMSPVPGRDHRGCFVHRTIKDLEAMIECGQRTKMGVVIGGGLLGLECAKALRDMNLQTYVVEFASRLMAMQVDDDDGHMLRRKIEDPNATVHTQKDTSEIVDDEMVTYRLNLADGTHLEVDMVAFSAGTYPRDELARACGLGVGERGGIAVDSECRISASDVYAIGECAPWDGKAYGSVTPDYGMARITTKQILAVDDVSESSGADVSTKLKLVDMDVASLDDVQGVTPGSRSVQFTDECKQIYKKLVVSEDGKYLLGGVLAGDTAEYGTLL